MSTDGVLVFSVLTAAIGIIAVFFVIRLSLNRKKKRDQEAASLTQIFQQSEWNRKQAESERDRTSTILKSFIDSLIIIDKNDSITLINPEAERMLGLNADKFMGRPVQSLAELSKAKPIINILNTGGKVVYRQEVELEKNFIVEFSVMSLADNMGRLIVLHDISKEKAIEKTKSEFVSLAAHQLRTPLSITRWSLSMLLGSEFGKLKKEQEEIIKKTLRNNDRLIKLVNSLLSVTRIEEGRYLYKFELADLRSLVSGVIESCQAEADDKKIILEFEKPSDPLQTMVDPEKITIVIQNLLDNAIKYSRDGGKILVSLKFEDDKIEFGVTDFGIGIAKEVQDRVFTKFFRGENAVKVNASGSGLGLFLVKNIIEAHGGIIWFKSEENVGTSFYFRLPIKTNAI